MPAVFRPARRPLPAAASPVTVLSAGLAAAVAATAFAPAASAAPPRTAAAQPGAQPDARPVGRALRVPKNSPVLEATLVAWYEATKGVNKLEGKHIEVRADKSFRAETHRVGQFFYEAPDHGRIDMEPRPEAECVPTRRTDGAGRPAAPYAVQPGSPKKWVCDGERLLDIKVKEREANLTALPPQHRGSNIMNGPLPFLLGMPPEAVKKRFRMRMMREPKIANRAQMDAWLADPNSQVMLEVLPLLQQDMANWEKAQVLLRKPDFMPVRVKLFEPGGESDTTYIFSDFKVNASGFLTLFKGDPFKPNLTGYKIVPVGAGAAQPAAGPAPVAAANRGQLPQIVPGGREHAGPRRPVDAGRARLQGR